MSENNGDLQRDFNKIIKDFIKDILNTFPELEENLNEHLKNIINDPDSESESLNIVKDF